MTGEREREIDATCCFVVVGSQPASFEERAECKQIHWVSRVLVFLFKSRIVGTAEIFV